MVLLLSVVINVEIGPGPAVRPGRLRREGPVPVGGPEDRQTLTRHVLSVTVTDDVVQVVVEVGLTVLTPSDTSVDGGVGTGAAGVQVVSGPTVTPVDPGPETTATRATVVPEPCPAPTSSHPTGEEGSGPRDRGPTEETRVHGRCRGPG